MADRVQAPWEELGYGDIVSVTRVGDDVDVTFANGDIVTVSPTTFGLDAKAFRVDFDPEEGLSVRLVAENGQTVELSWTQIRAATDPGFAQEMRRRDAEEARRIGRRLKALREDRNLTQRDVAQLVGMSPPQLSKIESGASDLRLSTLRALLRAMGATFADIAGPEAPEVSQKVLRRHATRAGVPRDAIDRLLGRLAGGAATSLVARAFGWSEEALIEGTLENRPLAIPVSFKTTAVQQPTASPVLHLALQISRTVLEMATLPPPGEVPADPHRLRSAALEADGQVTLSSLLEWAWAVGIPVIPIGVSGDFTAATWRVDGRPVVIIKDSRSLVVYWLFDLAHELGHIAHGHLRHGGIVDIDFPGPREGEDAEEEQANAFALDLLLPDHQELLTAVRRESRGNYLRFKGAVETIAEQAEVSPGLLGMVAAYALTDIGEDKDRWGSATNLARHEGEGRPITQKTARERLDAGAAEDLNRLLLETFVLEDGQ